MLLSVYCSIRDHCKYVRHDVLSNTESIAMMPALAFGGCCCAMELAKQWTRGDSVTIHHPTTLEANPSTQIVAACVRACVPFLRKNGQQNVERKKRQHRRQVEFENFAQSKNANRATTIRWVAALVCFSLQISPVEINPLGVWFCGLEMRIRRG